MMIDPKNRSQITTYSLVCHLICNLICSLILIHLSTHTVSARAETPVSPTPPSSSALTDQRARYELNGSTLVITPLAEGEAQRLSLPCAGRALALYGEVAYVACGASGVVIISLADAQPRISAHRVLSGEATGFFEVEGRVWVKLSTVTAQPLGSSAQSSSVSGDSRGGSITPQTSRRPQTAQTSASTPASARPQAGKRSSVTGEVVKLKAGAVVVNMGRAQGVKVGDRVELFTRSSEDMGDGEVAERETTLAVGVVTVVNQERAVVKLGLGESAGLKTYARVTSHPVTKSRYAPPHALGLTEYQVNLRPFLGVGTFGMGVLADGQVGHRYESGLHITGLISPLGIGFGDDGNILAFAANLVASYDSQLFEIGVGLGGTMINDDLDTSYSGYDEAALASAESGTPKGYERINSAVSFVQMIRLGALDGFNIQAYNTFLFYEDAFEFGGADVRVQLPVAERSWLVGRGGGGFAGFSYGEVGLRVLVRGNGGADSLFITPKIGGVSLFGETEEEPKEGEYCYRQTDDGKCIQNIEYSGPMIGVGLEWRR